MNFVCKTHQTPLSGFKSGEDTYSIEPCKECLKEAIAKAIEASKQASKPAPKPKGGPVK